MSTLSPTMSARRRRSIIPNPASSPAKAAAGAPAKAISPVAKALVAEPEIEHTSARGAVIFKIEAYYLGTVRVTETQGREACMHAVELIQQKMRDPKRVMVTVSEKGVYVDDKKTESLVVKVPLDDLAYVGLDPRNKKLFSIMVHKAALDSKQCYSFSVKNHAKEVPKACKQALERATKYGDRAETEATMIAGVTTIMPVDEELLKEEPLEAANAPDDEATAEDGGIAPRALSISKSRHASVSGPKSPPSKRVSRVSDTEADEATIEKEFASPTGVGKAVRRDSLDKKLKKMGISDHTTNVPAHLRETCLGAYKMLYLGSVPVREVDGTNTVTDAALRLSKKNEPELNAILIISPMNIVVVDAMTHDLMTECSMSHITFHYLDPNDRSTFYFITYNPRVGIAFCHIMIIQQNTNDLSMVVTTAIRTAKSAHKQNQIKGVQGYVNHGELSIRKALGIYESAFLGAVEVKEELTAANGNKIIQTAFGELRKQKRLADESDESAKVMYRNVAMVVSNEGIRSVDVSNGEVVEFSYVNNIRFFTVMSSTSAQKLDIFAYANVDRRLNKTTALFFKCFEDVRVINRTVAFALKNASETKTEANPFKPNAPTSVAGLSRLFAPELIINRRDLTAIEAIGSGVYGQVFLAAMVCSGHNRGTQNLCAVKVLREMAPEIEQENFLQEAITLADLEHPNLVQFYGISVTHTPWLVAMEYMKYGDLQSVLRTCKSRDIDMSYAEQLHFALQISAGLEYLAANQLVHMDVSAKNCLVGDGNVVKLSDFGLAKKYNPGTKHYKMTDDVSLRLALKWLSPEAFSNYIFSEKSDMWAFGVLLWEIAADGAVPYGDVKASEVRRFVQRGLRPEQPETCPAEFYETMQRCWMENPAGRWTFHEITHHLKVLLDMAIADGYPLRDVCALISGNFSKAGPGGAHFKRTKSAKLLNMPGDTDTIEREEYDDEPSHHASGIRTSAGGRSSDGGRNSGGRSSLNGAGGRRMSGDNFSIGGSEEDNDDDGAQRAFRQSVATVGKRVNPLFDQAEIDEDDTAVDASSEYIRTRSEFIASKFGAEVGDRYLMICNEHGLEAGEEFLTSFVEERNAAQMKSLGLQAPRNKSTRRTSGEFFETFVTKTKQNMRSNTLRRNQSAIFI